MKAVKEEKASSGVKRRETYLKRKNKRASLSKTKKKQESTTWGTKGETSSNPKDTSDSAAGKKSILNTFVEQGGPIWA